MIRKLMDLKFWGVMLGIAWLVMVVALIAVNPEAAAVAH
ncbi:hypothetical protein FHS23_003842 [Prauserella isguenensis]|uniref:Uncharacterized protein n=1 Tax=Prauserella isguenensis TaxID=1470180 RepID=A0A839S3Y9_9PSEU|nr:hypothetical protein [Prauserella isguenensis]